MSAGFKAYIAHRRVTDTPNGDFVQDAKSDQNFPDATSWDQVEGYLRIRGASPEAIAAGLDVWRQFINGMNDAP